MTITVTSADGQLQLGPPTQVTVRSAVFGELGRRAHRSARWCSSRSGGRTTSGGCRRARAARGRIGVSTTVGDDRLLRSSAAVATGTLLSRLTGLVRVFVLAYAVGLGTLADGYNIANATPNIVYELVLGGVLSATLVPLFVEHIAHGDDRATSAIFTDHAHRAHRAHRRRDALRAVDRPAVRARHARLGARPRSCTS